MPQAPIIIPIIITGILVGTIAASKGQMVKRKKLLLASLLSGILNTANAYLLILLTPARTPSQFQGQFQSVTTTAQTTYRYRGGGGNYQLMLVISSFIVGFLIPLAVIGISMLYARRKAGKGTDEENGGDEIDALREENGAEKEEDTEDLFKKDSKKGSKNDSKKDLKQDSDEEF
jgi:hypothetical protein